MAATHPTIQKAEEVTAETNGLTMNHHESTRWGDHVTIAADEMGVEERLVMTQLVQDHGFTISYSRGDVALTVYSPL